MRHMPAIWQWGSAGAVAFALLVAPAKSGSDAAPNPEKLRHLVIQDCGSCHGLSLKGGLGKPLTAEHLSQWDREQLVHIILEGVPGTPMPAWRPLMSEADARWIADMLKQGRLQ